MSLWRGKESRLFMPSSSRDPDDPRGVKVSSWQCVERPGRVRMTLKVNVSRYGMQKRDETAGLWDSLNRQTSICKGPGNVENPESAILPPSPLGLQRLVDIIDNVDNKKLSTNIFVVE